MPLPPGRTQPPRKRNILLYPEENEMVLELSRLTGLSTSAVIRNLIQASYNMRARRVPACATGASCLCPGMHQHAPAPQPVMGTQAPAVGIEPPAPTVCNDMPGPSS